MPDSTARMIASGTMYLPYQGGPSACFSPVIASEISGKNVPQKTTNVIATSTRLFPRNTASRESSDSIRCSLASSRRRETTSPIEAAQQTAISAVNAHAIPLPCSTNAWIESRMPLRTRNVPTIASVPVASVSETFQIFSIPRFSWIWTEWISAVAVSQGSSAAFSTGSQAQ